MSSNQQHEVSCIIVKFYFTCIAVKNRENLCFFLTKQFQYLEVLCKQLYEATEPTERTAAEKALVDFSDRPDCLQKCLMLLEQGTVSDFAKNFSKIINFTVELYSRHLFLDCLRSTCCCYNVNKINFKTVCRGIR